MVGGRYGNREDLQKLVKRTLDFEFFLRPYEALVHSSSSIVKAGKVALQGNIGF